MAPKPKTLEYRQAQWLRPHSGGTLEEILRTLWTRHPHHMDRIAETNADDRIIGMQSKDFGSDGFAISCAKYTDGESVGTISMDRRAPTDIGDQPPQVNENYLRSGFLVFARGNHVIGMNLGRNGMALTTYLIRLSGKWIVPHDDANVLLVRIARIEKIAMLQRLGARQIELSAALSDTAFSDLQTGLALQETTSFGGRRRLSTAMHATFGMLGALVRKTPDAANLLNANRGTSTIVLTIPENDVVAAKNSLNAISQGLIENDEERSFTIHLRDGKSKITSDEIAVCKIAHIQSASNFILIDDGFNKMYDYFKELQARGMLS